VENGSFKLTYCDPTIKIRVGLESAIHFSRHTANRERGLADHHQPENKNSGKIQPQ
jgi:hypothetical protein